ncbi:MAG TPA: PsbP-related protein [Candidatus Acidoferrum sp.]|nr:PsbP-related protein [Candidatus Acidoferrum sp.]
MNRTVAIMSLALAFGITAVAEELVLKDGTKIVGKMTAINGDKIEVETSYGKMQVNRADIVSISFPENNPGGAPAPAAAKTELPTIDESLKGTDYVNRTGKFSLSLPAGWKVNPALRASPDVIAALSSTDDLRYLVVVSEIYPASLDSYKGLVEIQGKKNLQNYEKVSETPTKIDGKSALLLSYRGVSTAAENLPIHFLVAIVQTPDGFLRITTWCVEPLFSETQAAFEKILRSYHVTG